MKRYALLSVFLLLTVNVFSQWTQNPYVNTLVSGNDLNEFDSQIAADSSGSFYIAYSKMSADSNLWLQRLDHNGYLKWGAKGICINILGAIFPVPDYYLTIDFMGNALLANNEERGESSTSQIYLYCNDTTGTPVWGLAGIPADTTSVNAHNPGITLTQQGNILISWNCNSSYGNGQTAIRLMKFSSSGTPLWSGPLLMDTPDSTNTTPILAPVENDDFIMVWQHRFQMGKSMLGTTILAQRFNSMGNPVWQKPVEICNHGDSAFVLGTGGPQIAAANDGFQGIYVGWTEDRHWTGNSNAIYVQYIDSGGNLRYVMNGIPLASPTEDHQLSDPLFACSNFDGSLCAGWKDEHLMTGSPNTYAIWGQRMNVKGNLLWGTNGKILKSASDTLTFISDIQVIPENEILITFDKNFETGIVHFVDNIFSMKLDSTGSFLWDPQYVLIGGRDEQKSRPAAVFSKDIYVLTWQENPIMWNTYIGDIYAQDIDMNGNIGPLAVPLREVVRSTVRISPNPSGTKTWLEFQNPTPGTAEITLFDETGKKIYAIYPHINESNRRILLNIPGLGPGIYFVKTVLNSVASTQKWIVTAD